MPLLTSPIDSPSLPEAPVAISLAGTQILIVNDESEQIDLMTFVLENCYELLQRVRSMPAGQIPAIALTAFTDATEQERSRQAGFQHHLIKPIEPDLLAMTILSVIEQLS